MESGDSRVAPPFGIRPDALLMRKAFLVTYTASAQILPADEFFHAAFDLVAHFSRLFGRKIFRIG
jgi:hypothetical protein